ncbi:MAG: hypothetical protein II507_01945, partial [Treponema sp.]|nr:hypothetical protein [Treponema sp.]
KKSKEGFFLCSYLKKSNKPMEGRLNSPEICIANLRYPGKSMEGFFRVIRPIGRVAKPDRRRRAGAAA